jgi:vacuolar-type H+-ATPase subunit I/STV1
MEKMLAKIGEFSGVLGELRGLVIEVSNKIATIKQQQDLIKIEQDTRSSDLDAREAKVKKIEDIIALRNETKDLINRQEIRAEEIVKERQEFNSFVEKVKKELSEKEEIIKQGLFNNDLETKALIKAREDLEKEKMEYKFKFIKGLVQAGGDK